MKIGILGGTGPAGSGLAARLTAGGQKVYVGSRDPARAEATVGRLIERGPGTPGSTWASLAGRPSD